MFKQTLSHENDSLIASTNSLTLDRPNSTDASKFDSIPSTLEALKAGQAVVVVDNENRENEGDLICAAQFATPASINFMAVQARG